MGIQEPFESGFPVLSTDPDTPANTVHGWGVNSGESRLLVTGAKHEIARRGSGIGYNPPALRRISVGRS
ncbi:MAG: hypothetical protein CL908_23630 [Deltaproteobacteria bacterium]|nr:hypothetical protein [Deltaproteobacteria bacterium]